jgi:hypothetical protein
MYMRFLFFLGENSVNYLPEDSLCFFSSRGAIRSHMFDRALSSVRKKIHESVEPKKTTRAREEKEGGC